MQDTIPTPVKDQENLPSYHDHNKPVFNTPSKAEDMKPRIVDDYKPQGKMRSLLAAGKRTTICHVKKLSYFLMRPLQNPNHLFQKTRCAAAIAYLPK